MPTTTTRTAWCGCELANGARTCTNCDECPNCCQCQECDECGRRFYPDDFCEHCDHCYEHCHCEICEACGRRTDHDDHAMCSQCLRCLESCCECYRCRECRVKSRPEDFCPDCSKCFTHCRCRVCTVCNVKQRPADWCALCNKCHTHCTCPTCSHCGNRYRETDRCEDGCGRCTVHCRCRMTGVEFRRGQFKMYDAVFAKGELKTNRLTRHISAEIEVDRYRKDKNSKLLNESLDKWGDAVVSDGSVPDGFEINTNPCSGDLWTRHIHELCEGFKKIEATCSPACGLHIHINAKDLTYYDLRKVILIYHKIEPAFFELCEARRLTGSYSVPCGSFFMTRQKSPEEFRKELTQKMYLGGMKLPTAKGKGANSKLITYGSQIKQKKGHKYEGIRYKALNLHSYFLRGSIEFRHKEGTTDYSEITNWGMICANIIERAAKLSEKQIVELPGGLQSDGVIANVTRDTSREALLALLPQNLRDFAERKWAAQEARSSRWKAEVDERWTAIGQFRG